MRAAQIVRNELFQFEYNFKGSLTDDSYEQLPPSLHMLNRMILEGTNFESIIERVQILHAVLRS